MVQWLQLHIPTAEGAVSVLGWGNEDPTCCVAKKKKLTIILILNQVSFFKSLSLYIFFVSVLLQSFIFSFKQYLGFLLLLLQLVLLIS